MRSHRQTPFSREMFSSPTHRFTSSIVAHDVHCCTNYSYTEALKATDATLDLPDPGT